MDKQAVNRFALPKGRRPGARKNDPPPAQPAPRRPPRSFRGARHWPRPAPYRPLEAPIVVPGRPSPRLMAVDILVHLGALLGLFLADFGLGWKALAGVVIAWRGVRSLRSRLAQAQLSFRLDGQDRWWLLREDGKALRLRRLPGSFVHPRLVVLRFKDENGRVYSQALRADNMDAPSLRRLRVRLRFPLRRARF